MTRLVLFLILAAIAWVVYRLVKIGSRTKHEPDDEKVEYPPDASFKNIEEADFEDLSSDRDNPDKPS